MGAAYEFGLVAEGVEREGIGARCVEVVADGEVGSVVEEAGLRGLGREAAKGLALACARHGKGQRLGWRYVRSAHRMLEGWMRANGGANAGRDKVSWFQESVCELDVGAMPLKALREVVEGSEYVDRGWAAGLIERKEAAGDNAYEVEYKEERRYDMGEDFTSDSESDDDDYRPQGIGYIALDDGGGRQRMAVIDELNCRAVIVDLGSGERLATAGLVDEGPGELPDPCGLAFSGTGELYISDEYLHRILVFDRQGRYVRGFGSRGGGWGQFRGPEGLCFTADGDLVVADALNDRVQVLRQDGTFVRAIGTQGSKNGQFDHPRDVCCRPDGSIAVLDSDNKRVQVFDKEWKFVRSIGSKGDGPGQFQNPSAMAVGKGGEIIVTDGKRRDMQVFSAEGELLQIIGANGDSHSDRAAGSLRYTMSYRVVAADAEGRLIVALTDDRSVVVLS